MWSCEEPVLAVHSMNPSTTAIQLINGSILHYSPGVYPCVCMCVSACARVCVCEPSCIMVNWC